MSTLNVDFKVGKLTNLGYTFITIFLISVCVVFVRIAFLNTGVSLEDFARFEILYNMIGILLGLFFSQSLVKQRKKGRLRPYGGRGSLKR